MAHPHTVSQSHARVPHGACDPPCLLHGDFRHTLLLEHWCDTTCWCGVQHRVLVWHDLHPPARAVPFSQSSHGLHSSSTCKLYCCSVLCSAAGSSVSSGSVRRVTGRRIDGESVAFVSPHCVRLLFARRPVASPSRSRRPASSSPAALKPRSG